MDLWTFAVRLYQSPGVQPAALALQDADGVDVNMMLFAAWCGAQRAVALGAADFQAVEAAVGPWRRQVVLPLRSVRRLLKVDAFGGFEPAQAGFRKEVAALELRAERLQLDAMSATRTGTPATASASLALSNVEALLSFASVADTPRRQQAVAAIRLALDRAW